MRVAWELARSPELDRQQGWSAYCRSDPQGAFDSLSKGEITAANGALWNVFLGALAFGDETNKAIRDDLAVHAFDHLTGFSSDVLRPMAAGLADLIFFAPRQRIENLDRWLDRLWEIISEQPEQPFDLSTDMYENAINSSAGKLAQTLLLEIDARRQVGADPSPRQLRCIREISSREGTAGQLGRAVLAHNLAFLLGVDQQCMIDMLVPRISAANAEGVALRAVMLKYGSVTPELTQVLGQAIITGVIESESSDYHAATIASKILRPALADIQGDTAVRWGLTASDVAQAVVSRSVV